jgi:hypothetical protein
MQTNAVSCNAPQRLGLGHFDSCLPANMGEIFLRDTLCLQNKKCMNRRRLQIAGNRGYAQCVTLAVALDLVTSAIMYLHIL